MKLEDLSFGWAIWLCGKQVEWFETKELMLKKLDWYKKSLIN
jgi:hypothetical protein